MRSTYCPGVCTIPGTYYQGWFMYMRYTQGQNEEYLLSRSMYWIRYLLSGLVYVHEVYTGTEWGALTIQEYVPNQALSKQVTLYVYTICGTGHSTYCTCVYFWYQPIYRWHTVHGYIRTYVCTVRTSQQPTLTWIHTYIHTYSTHIVATHAHMDTYIHTYIQYVHRSNPHLHALQPKLEYCCNQSPEPSKISHYHQKFPATNRNLIVMYLVGLRTYVCTVQAYPIYTYARI